MDPITIHRTNADHPDFIRLVGQLDAGLAVLNGEQHDFYSAFNTLDAIRQVVLAYAGDEAVGCGALKSYAPGIVELKRMFVDPAWRQRGVGGRVLQALEDWASELGAHTCILETSVRLDAANALYTRHGFSQIPNYGQYEGVADSRCYQKTIAAPSSGI